MGMGKMFYKQLGHSLVKLLLEGCLKRESLKAKRHKLSLLYKKAVKAFQSHLAQTALL